MSKMKHYFWASGTSHIKEGEMTTETLQDVTCGECMKQILSELFKGKPDKVVDDAMSHFMENLKDAPMHLDQHFAKVNGITCECEQGTETVDLSEVTCTTCLDQLRAIVEGEDEPSNEELALSDKEAEYDGEIGYMTHAHPYMVCSMYHCDDFAMKDIHSYRIHEIDCPACLQRIKSEILIKVEG